MDSQNGSGFFMGESAGPRMSKLRSDALLNFSNSFQWYTQERRRYANHAISLNNVIVIDRRYRKILRDLELSQSFATLSNAVREASAFVSVLTLIVRANFANLEEQANNFRSETQHPPQHPREP